MAVVNTRHPQYTDMLPKWTRCRDVAEGQDAIYARGHTYLPGLKQQDPQDYSAMQKRTPFYNATWRTIDGLNGMLFRKEARVEVAASILPMLDDINQAGEPLHVFAQQVGREALTVGRVGVLADYPQTDPEVRLTRAQAESMGLRPSLQRFCAEAIINWKTATIENQHVLILVVLEEEVPIESEFGHEKKKMWRVLDLVRIDNEIRYRVRTAEIDERTDREIWLTEIFPMMDGWHLNRIPFEIFGVDKLSANCDEPPLIDLVNMNLHHFVVSSTYEHGCHFTGLPTPIITGYMHDASKGPLSIGSTSAWVFDSPNADAKYLEFSGAGLTALERNLDRKEKQMAAIGARLLMNESSSNETATTAMIRHSGETSILAAIAQCISMGMERMLRIFSQWAGADLEATYQINKNFLPMAMDGATLTAHVNAWQKGAFSHETLFNNLKSGEVVPDDASFEDEQARIDAEPDKMGAALPFGNMPSLVNSKPAEAKELE